MSIILICMYIIRISGDMYCCICIPLKINQPTNHSISQSIYCLQEAVVNEHGIDNPKIQQLQLFVMTATSLDH